jgi:hypothetical protein
MSHAESSSASDGSASPARADSSPVTGGEHAAGAPAATDAPRAASDGSTSPARADKTPSESGTSAGSDTEGVRAESETADEEAPKGPKMVRRVVVSYQLGWLPGDWLQTWRRLDRTFARADLQVKAILAPLEDLPEGTDILVVPPELREAAREAAVPGTPILVTSASSAAGAFGDLVSRLQAGTEFTAERVDPDQADKPRIVSYRGHTIIE